MTTIMLACIGADQTEIGVERPPAAFDDSYIPTTTLAENITGLYQAEVIHQRWPCKTLDDRQRAAGRTQDAGSSRHDRSAG